jgi:hypothetical protein
MISMTEVSVSYRHISLNMLEKFPGVLERVSFELGRDGGKDDDKGASKKE